ncbi:hypothetical protein ABT336_24215 [Micromonospora sp. NPDC000207]|uniref:hypothetical protein n=1 Tax=Micromonospora sp. NPDC000207 TaxID=3154246 RepID=UPI00331D6C4B
MPGGDGQLTAAEVAALYALVRAQAVLRQRIVEQAVAAATLPWTVFGGWWSSAEIGQLVASVLRVVQPLQRQAAQVTDAFLARQLSVTTGRRVEPVGVVDVTRLRRALPDPGGSGAASATGSVDLADVGDGRDGSWFTGNFMLRDAPEVVDYSLPDDGRGWMNPMVVYGRPADTYRWQVSERNTSPEVAVERAVLRARQIAETDVGLAVRAQARKVAVSNRAVTGTRRILHPEKSKDGFSCGLCVVAADRIYKKTELMPIHGGCNCETALIANGVDPGLDLNVRDLEAIYEAGGGARGGRRLQNQVRVSITEHGELGPILVRSNHRFVDPGEVARRKVKTRVRRRWSDQSPARRPGAVVESAGPARPVLEPGRLRTADMPSAAAVGGLGARLAVGALEASIARLEEAQRRGGDWSALLARQRAELRRLRNLT